MGGVNWVTGPGPGPGTDIPVGFYTGLATGISEGGVDTGTGLPSMPFQAGAQGGVSAAEIAGHNADVAANQAAAIASGFGGYGPGGAHVVTQADFGTAPVGASSNPTILPDNHVAAPKNVPSWAFGDGGGVSSATSAVRGAGPLPIDRNAPPPSYAAKIDNTVYGAPVAAHNGGTVDQAPSWLNRFLGVFGL